eukprot:5084972-Karenia_brevis.AAC.1
MTPTKFITYSEPPIPSTDPMILWQRPLLKKIVVDLYARFKSQKEQDWKLSNAIVLARREEIHGPDGPSLVCAKEYAKMDALTDQKRAKELSDKYNELQEYGKSLLESVFE